MTKRRLVKREIHPKVSIMEDMGADYNHVYYQQRLVPGEFLFDEKHLKRFYEADQINSQYIQSIFCEEYEKPLLENIA